MNRSLLALLALSTVLTLTTGCYSTQEGRVKAGVPFLKDSITSRYEIPYARAYEAAKAVLKTNGTLTNDDQVTKVLRGTVNGRSIWIKLDDTEPRITTVVIQARTGGGTPDVDMASEIDKQIYGQLISMNK